MQPKYLLFLEDTLEAGVSAYLSQHLGAGEPVLLEQFSVISSELKDVQEPVIVVTQKRLADEQEELGTLDRSIRAMWRASVIVLPNASFLNKCEPNEKPVSVEDNRIEAQFLRCLRQCADECMPRHSVFYIE